MDNYNIKYIGEFLDYDLNEIYIKIYKKDYDGSFEYLNLSDNPLIISTPSHELTDTIYGTGMKLYFINTTGNLQKYDEFFINGDKDFYIIVEKNGDYLFEGFIIPELFSQKLDNDNNVTISASNQLTFLKDYYPTILNNNENYITQIDLIKDIIWSTGIHQPIYIKNSVYTDDMGEEYNINVTPFEFIYVQTSMYISNSGKLKDSYTVLDDILNLYNSRLYYDNRKWVIERVPEIKSNNSFKVYNYNGTTTTASQSPRIHLLNNFKFINNSGELSLDNAYKQFELKLNQEKIQNLINPSFHKTHVCYFDKLTRYLINVHDYIDFPYGNKLTWFHPLVEPFIFYNKNFSNKDIVKGIHYEVNTNDVGGTFNKNPSLTTTFSMKYDVTSNLKISFTISNEGITIPYHKNIQYQVGLRYRDELAPHKNRWISGTSKPNLQTTIIPTFYTINLSGDTFGKYDDVKEVFKAEISINIGELMTQIKNHIAEGSTLKSLDFYLDFYPPKNLNTNKWMQYKLGDIVVSSSGKEDPNVILAEIDNLRNKKKQLSLNQYCSDDVSILNSLYRFKSVDVYTLLDKVRLKDSNYHNNLQLLYLSNIIQQFNKNRYMISADMYFNNTDIKIGDIFQYSHLKDEQNNLLNFVLLGVEYNVKESSYRLQLINFIEDDGFFLIDELDLGEDEILNINPENVELDYGGGWWHINIESNAYWEVTTDVDWIVITIPNGQYTGYTSYIVAENYDNVARFGTITIKSLNNTKTVSITQDYFIPIFEQ